MRKRGKYCSPNWDYACVNILYLGCNLPWFAKHFQEAVDVTGVVLAKLDGSAKGGMVFAIEDNLGLPVRFVGTGESIDDLAEFDPDQFVEGLFS